MSLSLSPSKPHRYFGAGPDPTGEAVPIFDSHSLEIVVRILFIVVLASRLKLSLLLDSELLPITKSAGQPIAPQIRVDNFSWSETVDAVTSLADYARLDSARVLA